MLASNWLFTALLLAGLAATFHLKGSDLEWRASSASSLIYVLMILVNVLVEVLKQLL